MGLDLALGGMILIAALRGWFKGFVLQAIRLGGLVACVYAADPVRDQVRPRIVAHLPSIRPELVDRLLWWASAGVSYVVLVGLACLIVKLYRQQSLGLEERNRLDQFGGLLFGAAKGVLAVAFLVSGLRTYGASMIANIPWAQEQSKTSRAFAWDEQYHPAERIWTSPPVQLVVQQIQRKGLNPPSTASDEESKPVQTASRTPKLQWTSDGRAILPPSDLDPEVARAVESVRATILKPPTTN